MYSLEFVSVCYFIEHFDDRISDCFFHVHCPFFIYYPTTFSCNVYKINSEFRNRGNHSIITHLHRILCYIIYTRYRINL